MLGHLVVRRSDVERKNVGLIIAARPSNSTGGSEHWEMVSNLAQKAYWVLFNDGVKGPFFVSDLIEQLEHTS